MPFGASLRMVRLAAGVGLRDLAGTIGVSPAYLSRVERGHDPPPTPDRIVALARALALAPSLLLEAAGVRGEDDFAARALHAEIVRRRLTPAQIGRVLEFVDRTFPTGASPSRLGELLAPERVVRDVQVTGLRDALDIAAMRLDPSVNVHLGALDPLATAVGGGLLLPHVATGPAAAALVLLARPLPAGTPDHVSRQGQERRLIVERGADSHRFDRGQHRPEMVAGMAPGCRA